MYCGDLPASLVDGQTSWVYPSIPVQPLYLSCYVTNNKQCCCTSRCATFHSGDPNQVVPFVLYTVLLYTVLLYTHTSASTSQLSLSPS